MPHTLLSSVVAGIVELTADVLSMLVEGTELGEGVVEFDTPHQVLFGHERQETSVTCGKQLWLLT